MTEAIGHDGRIAIVLIFSREHVKFAEVWAIVKGLSVALSSDTKKARSNVSALTRQSNVGTVFIYPRFAVPINRFIVGNMRSDIPTPG